MGWIISGILVIVVIILIIKYNQKLILDKTELQQFSYDINRLKEQKSDLQKDIETQNEIIEDYNNKILNIQYKYQEALNQKNIDLNTYFDEQRATRQKALDNLIKEKENNLELNYKQEVLKYEDAIRAAESNAEQLISQADLRAEQIKEQVAYEEKRYQNLIAPLKQYEMDKQQRLFYTIQVPDEYKDDIDFLLNTVSQKVRHPDIINKLVWAEYVKPYLDDTFKRIEIRAEPGIYKLTNIDTGKSYIGKSTDVKKRISDHMKSSIGISSIADQAVHHAILETGFWNWTIEIITYCEKDKLSELEKYYIDFFKTQEYGFNKTGGG